MTTVSTPHSKNQSTSRCRSVVKVPSCAPARACDLHPRRPRAWSPRHQSQPRLDASPTSYGGPCPSIYSDPLSILLLGAEGLGCADDQLPKRDRLTASPLSRALQPMDHVFLRGTLPPKTCRPLPSVKRIHRSRFYAHRRIPVPDGFLKAFCAARSRLG